MNTDIDDLVRDAVRRQEELATDPERIRDALPARAARRARQHRTVTLAGVAVAVAAIAVTVPTIVDRDPNPADPPATSTTTAPAPSPDMATAPLRYRPTWLPAGMTARVREAPLTGEPDPKLSTIQLWKDSPVENGPVESAHIGLYSWPSEANAQNPPPPAFTDDRGNTSDVSGHEVDINGRTAYYDSGVLTWQVDDHTKLMIVTPGLNLPEADIVRIARSIRPDDTRLHAPLRLDWLPDGLTKQQVSVAGNGPDEWQATMVVEGTGGQSYVAVSAGTRDTTPVDGEKLTINGHPAQLAEVDIEEAVRANYRTRWVLRVELAPGLHLTVRGGTTPSTTGGPLTREDIVKIAENVVLDPNPDLAWLGR